MTKEDFQKTYDQYKNEFEAYVDQSISQWRTLANPAEEIRHLIDSMSYSVSMGGKRFRPVLSLMVADLLEHDRKDVLAFALSVEMIHTYSLIHDDLPCMDDDDERRGKPTNHKVYGEDIALIAGDNLLTLAFENLATAYGDRPALAVNLIKTLAKASGTNGMIGGQAIDLKAQKDGIKETELHTLHAFKTGALIAVAAEGAALICEASENRVSTISDFARSLGLAFQIADDLLDFEPSNPELGNFATVIGEGETKALLQKTTDRAVDQISFWGDKAETLTGLVEFNFSREL